MKRGKKNNHIRIKVVIISFFFILIISLPISLAAQLQTLVYDGNGNLITGDGKYREYNEFNQLIRVYNGSNVSVDGLIEKYVWHPTEDRILVKYINIDYGEAAGTDEATMYINDYFVRHFSNLGGVAKVNDTYYIKDEQGILAEILFNGTELNMTNFNEVKRLYYHGDHLGSTTLITNESGELVEETFYTPYGQIISGGNASRFSYEGKEYSEYTRDYDFEFRKYDAELGLFTQPDAIVKNAYDPQTLNPYRFESNNPYLYIDEDGKVGIAFYGTGDFSASGYGESKGAGFLLTIDKYYGIQLVPIKVDYQGTSIISSPFSGTVGANIEFFPYALRVSDVVGSSRVLGIDAALKGGLGGFTSFTTNRISSFGLQGLLGYGAQAYNYDSTLRIGQYYFSLGNGQLGIFKTYENLLYTPLINTQNSGNFQNNLGTCNYGYQSCYVPPENSNSKNRGSDNTGSSRIYKYGDKIPGGGTCGVNTNCL